VLEIVNDLLKKMSGCTVYLLMHSVFLKLFIPSCKILNLFPFSPYEFSFLENKPKTRHDGKLMQKPS
jgi:hypothetical protein